MEVMLKGTVTDRRTRHSPIMRSLYAVFANNTQKLYDWTRLHTYVHLIVLGCKLQSKVMHSLLCKCVTMNCS
jgi:hypothetical protein